jgi:hypothetical protein
METLGMKQIATLFAGLLLAATAGAGDVYVTRDAQGNTVYTDTPQTVPAQKVDVRVGNPEPATDEQGPAAPATQPRQPAQAASDSPAQTAAAQQAAETTAEDKAKRCTDARQRYQTLWNSWRLYEPGPNGERTYLTSEQIDKARADAKQVMDQFCSDQ